MAVLKAMVADRDGIIHELVLKQRDRNGVYRWYFEGVALIATPAATPDEALRILQREIAPAPTGSLQLISISRDEAGD